MVHSRDLEGVGMAYEIKSLVSCYPIDDVAVLCKTFSTACVTDAFSQAYCSND